MLPSLDRCYDIQYTPNCTYENYQKEKIKSYQMLTYDLEKRGRAPKYAYLYACIRKDILRGVLAPGSRLPSRRELAEHLGCSLATVDGAYSLLAEEGYAFSRERSGFFVSRDFDRPREEPPEAVLRLSRDPEGAPAPETDFRFSALTKIMRETISRYGEKLLEKPPHNGCAALRNAIAQYLLRYRGMVAQPEQIVVGSGAEYLYGLLVQLLGRDKVFGLENPSYEKIQAVYESHGARCRLLEMDELGVSPAALGETDADVLHVTPTHSFPSDRTAPVSRRLAYLRWAEARGGVIIEDDFASEFARRSKPMETLFQLDRAERVIYLNTFSKSLAPSMRIGYMVLPEHLMAEYRRKLGFYSCTVPVFDQYVLAEFIDGGHFERHLRRMRRRLLDR